MSFTDYLPRLGLLERTHRKPKHSAPAEVERLRHKLAGAEMLMAGYRLQLDEAHAKQGEAEEIVVQHLADIEELTVERDEWRDRALALQARFGPQLAAEANANRITVPPMQRIGADQDTGTFDVTTLWQAAEAGRLGPVTDPGHIHTR